MANKKWIEEVLTPDDARQGLEVDAAGLYILKARRFLGRVEVELLGQDELESRPGVAYILRSLDSDGPGTLKGETDDQGLLKHDELPFGDYELEVQGQKIGVPVLWPDEPAWPVRMMDASNGWEPGTYLAARFLDASGQVPLANATATVAGQQVTTDEDGLLVLEADGQTVEVVFPKGKVEVPTGRAGECEEVALDFYQLGDAELRRWQAEQDAL